MNASTFARTAISGYGTSPGRLRTPRGIAFDARSQEIYIAEAGNNRLSRFSLQGTLLEVCPLPGAGTHEVHKLAMDSSGDLYVADAAANSVHAYRTDLSYTPPSLDREKVGFGSVAPGYRLLLVPRARLAGFLTNPNDLPLLECVTDPVATNPDDVLHAADAALYRAKRRGRNRVVIDGVRSASRSSAASRKREDEA